MAAVGDDGLRHAACGDDSWCGVKGGTELVYQPVDHSCCAVEYAALHALQGIATDEMGWFLDGDGGQL